MLRFICKFKFYIVFIPNPVFSNKIFKYAKTSRQILAGKSTTPSEPKPISVGGARRFDSEVENVQIFYFHE